MRKAFFFAALAVAAGACLFVAHAWFLPELLGPTLEELRRSDPPTTALMRWREGRLREEGRRVETSRSPIPLARMSPALVKAVLVSEDDKFYQHDGFDFEGMQDALEKDLKRGRFAAGGSTISQQLAKNLWLSPERSLLRKLREGLLTYRLERELTKRRILEVYLNCVEWGAGVYGAEAAARRHFGKSASALSAEEAARLAVVLPSPLRYDPAARVGYVPRRAAIIMQRMNRR